MRSFRIARSKLASVFEKVLAVIRDVIYLDQDVAIQNSKHDRDATGLGDSDSDLEIPLQWPTSSEGAPPERLSQATRCSIYTDLQSSIISHLACVLCTDMGAELGIADFRGALRDMLPQWHPWHSSKAQLESDAVLDIGDEDGNSDHIMSGCVPLPGICHVVDNLLQDVDERLLMWPQFHKELKNAGAILCRDQSRRHLYSTCVQGRAAHQAEDDWLKGVPNLYQPRWGQTVSF